MKNLIQADNIDGDFEIISEAIAAAIIALAVIAAIIWAKYGTYTWGLN